MDQFPRYSSYTISFANVNMYAFISSQPPAGLEQVVPESIACPLTGIRFSWDGDIIMSQYSTCHCKIDTSTA